MKKNWIAWKTWISSRLEINNNYIDKYEREVHYRQLSTETYADTFAIKIMSEHKK